MDTNNVTDDAFSYASNSGGENLDVGVGLDGGGETPVLIESDKRSDRPRGLKAAGGWGGGQEESYQIGEMGNKEDQALGTMV